VYLSGQGTLAPGDRFRAEARLKLPEGDSALYYRSQGIHLIAYGGEGEITPGGGGGYWTSRLRHRLEESLRETVPPDALGYAMALLTGNREELTPPEREHLKRAGLYHALALSGMHLCILVALVCGHVPGWRRRNLLGILLCIGFTVFTGASPSLVRAAVMMILVMLGSLLGRMEDTPTSLGLAGMLMLLQNPWSLCSEGLQLSIAAAAGLWYLRPRLYRLLSAGPWRRGPLRRRLMQSLATTLGAMAFTVPLQMVYYGTVSLLAPVSGILALWAVSWCFRGSILTALLGLIHPALGRLPGWCLGWLVRYVQGVAAVISRLPFASLSARNLCGAAWVLLVYGLGVLALRQDRKKQKPVVPACCAAAALAVLLSFTALEEQAASLTMLDVGQGQCLALCGRGQTVLVDCGGSAGETVGDLAANTLLSRGEDRVNLLILTHCDWDHVSGVPELLRRIPVTAVLLPETGEGSPGCLAVEQAARAAGTDVYLADQTMRLSAGGMEMELYPPVASGGGNYGLSLLADTGAWRVLVTGDMDALGERLLLEEQTLPRADVLVAGHHGAAGSCSGELLERIRPEIALISVGKNAYGQPAPETLERLAEAAVYRTDLSGTIVIKGG